MRLEQAENPYLWQKWSLLFLSKKYCGESDKCFQWEMLFYD